MSAIRQRFPGSRITLMTDRQPAGAGLVSSWEVLGDSGLFDDVFFYTPHRWSSFESLRAIARLAGSRFDHVYNLAAPRFGRQRVRRDAWLLGRLTGAASYHADNRPYDPSPAQVTEPEWLRLLRIVDPGATAAPMKGLPAIPERDRKDAERLLATLGIGATQSLVAIGPGSKMASKRWPEQRFEELGVAILERHPEVMLVAVGGSGDAPTGERLCARWGERSRNLAGRLGVYGTAAVLERARFYVGNDSGAMHLAAFSGTPCVAIFSARDAAGRWDPIGEGHQVLRHQTGCAGCMLEECVKEANKCLTLISVHSVLSATERMK
jgi:ADP-heptose:LPS heptosyltransferase